MEKWIDRAIQLVTLWILIIAVFTIPAFYSVLKNWDQALKTCAVKIQDQEYGR
jgi:hypothetical protein